MLKLHYRGPRQKHGDQSFRNDAAINQVKEDGIWDQGDSRRGDKRWSDSGYLSILKIKPINYIDTLQVECQIKGKLRNDFKHLGPSN